MATKQRRMTLREILQGHGITRLKDFADPAGLSRQHGWNLWHGHAGVGKQMMLRLHERLGLALEELIQIAPPTPPKPRGRPRKPRLKGEAGKE